jgi:predicted metal-dependent hydrolase
VLDPGRRSAAPPESLTLGDREVPLTVRRSARARRLALRIDAGLGAVELVLPGRLGLAAGLEFLAARRGWVAARLAVLPERIPFRDGAEIPLLGVPHRIRHLGERGAAGQRIVGIADGEIRVLGGTEHIGRRVRDHLKELARQECQRRARELAAQLERRVARVSVRDTTSRWGSCTASGNLAFSWRLVLAPVAVLDYVVAHEVAHLVEMNHGVRFWRLVGRLSPDWERQRAWLRRNRTRLLRYG